MSLPSSLAVNLRRFQSALHTSQRIMGDRSITSASVASFNLPRTGVVDLQSLTLLADFFTTGVTAGVTLTTPFYNSQMIRRVEFLVGGQPVSLSSCSDYGYCFLMSRIYGSLKARSDYQQSVAREGKVDVSSVVGSTTTPIVIASEWLGFLGAKHLRWLPMDLLPECQLNIYFADRSRWTQQDNSSANITAFELRNLRLNFKTAVFEDNMLSKLWAQRLNSAPIVVPFENVSYFEANASSATATNFSAFVNSQSVDLIMAGHRKGDYDSSYTNRWLTTAGHNTDSVKNQMYWNQQPISSFPLTVLDALMETQMSLGGQGNALYSPDLETQTYAGYRDSQFALFHKMALDTDAHEEKGFVTGTSTYGQAVEVSLTLTDGDTNSKKAVIVVFSTGTMEIAAGRQIAVAL